MGHKDTTILRQTVAKKHHFLHKNLPIPLKSYIFTLEMRISRLEIQISSLEMYISSLKMKY